MPNRENVHRYLRRYWNGKSSRDNGESRVALRHRWRERDLCKHCWQETNCLGTPQNFQTIFVCESRPHKVILSIRPFERVSHSGKRNNQVCEDCVDVEMINYFYYRWAETACAQIRREFTATVQSVQGPAPLSCTFVFSTLVLYCPIFIISTSS